MGLITDLIPLNLDTEREKFLANETYNPQFEYIREFSSEELTKYGMPNHEYFAHAKSMLQKYGVPKKSAEPICTPKEIKKEITLLFTKLNLPQLPINFSPEYPSQVMIKADELLFRTPIRFGHTSLKNKLNHEIQTHYLRRYNQQFQTWDLNSETKEPIAFRTTEEGLANLHSYIERSDHKMRKTYLNYYAAYQAQHLSFRTLYDELRTLGTKESLAWNLTVKQKRGLKNTSLLGGFSKNHVYFEGTVKVWNWLINEENDPRQLYWGRICLKDLEEVQNLTISDQIIYPTFFSNIATYRDTLISIGEDNHLATLPII